MSNVMAVCVAAARLLVVEIPRVFIFGGDSVQCRAQQHRCQCPFHQTHAKCLAFTVIQ